MTPTTSECIALALLLIGTVCGIYKLAVAAGLEEEEMDDHD